MVQSLVKKQGGMGKKKTKFLFSNQFWNDFTSCLPGCVKAVWYGYISPKYYIQQYFRDIFHVYHWWFQLIFLQLRNTKNDWQTRKSTYVFFAHHTLSWWNWIRRKSRGVKFGIGKGNWSGTNKVLIMEF